MYEIMSILMWHLQGEKILTESESKLYNICVCVSLGVGGWVQDVAEHGIMETKMRRWCGGR